MHVDRGIALDRTEFCSASFPFLPVTK